MEQRRGRSGRVPASVLRDEKDQIAIQVLTRCKELRIRAMAGGGSVLTARGLISPIVTRSLSIVVDPASSRHFTAEIRSMGWRPSMRRQHRGILPPVKHAFEHDDWRAILNAFSVIPGFFADPEETFDLLWERRRSVAVLGTTIAGLDRLSSAVLASHNSLDGRGSHASSYSDFFAEQFRKVLSEEERAELGTLVRQVGGGAEMSYFLEAMEVEPVEFSLPSVSYVRLRLGVDDASNQLRRAVAIFDSPPKARTYIFRTSPGRPRSVAEYLPALAQLPSTVRIILTARRRMAAAGD